MILFEAIAAICGVVALFLWYKIAHKDFFIAIILRTIWNFWCCIFALIPVIGFIFEKLIIKDDV